MASVPGVAAALVARSVGKIVSQAASAALSEPVKAVAFLLSIGGVAAQGASRAVSFSVAAAGAAALVPVKQVALAVSAGAVGAVQTLLNTARKATRLGIATVGAALRRSSAPTSGVSEGGVRSSGGRTKVEVE